MKEIIKTGDMDLIRILSVRLRRILEKSGINYKDLQELRIRVNEPFILIYENKEFFLDEEGNMTNELNQAVKVYNMDVKETLEFISNYSLYAYEDEVRQGFITIKGGHRVGIAGKVVLDGCQIKSVKHISFINIRMAHEIKGCSEKIMNYIITEGIIAHTLIISPPRCGKTTLLRDIIRQISNGNADRPGVTVGVVDERSEIGACYKGVPQNDVGIRTDVLDCCPKAFGMIMLIRAMSPDVVAVDEIGGREDVEAIYDVINCGCKILATVHGSSVDDIRNKPGLRKLVEERVFERYIILNNKDCIGHVENIFDARGTCLL